MKKSLLIAAALTLAVSANAQYARHQSTGKTTSAIRTEQLKDVKIEHRVLLSPPKGHYVCQLG